MSRFLQLVLMASIPFWPVAAPRIVPAAAPTNQSGSSGGPVESLLSSLFGGGAPEDESAVLQARLRSTQEEWSIIYPQLQRITALRAAVYASGAAATSSGNGGTRRMLDSPLGGTSMDAPTMVGSGGRWGGRTNPFDPARAPGSPSNGSALGGITRRVGRGMAGSLRLRDGNPVQALLTELQGLLEDTNTTDKQLWDKLTAIRAARGKAARELETAQRDLTELLTVDQLAVLMNLGYMD